MSAEEWAEITRLAFALQCLPKPSVVISVMDCSSSDPNIAKWKIQLQNIDHISEDIILRGGKIIENYYQDRSIAVLRVGSAEIFTFIEEKKNES